MKNNCFWIIFCTIFWVLPLRAALPLIPGCVLERDYTGNDGEFLRQLLRRVEYFTRLSRQRHGNIGTLDIIIHAPAFEYRRHKNKSQLLLPGDSSNWQRDFIIRQQLYGVFFTHIWQLPEQSGCGGVAPWVVAALDYDMYMMNSYGKYLAGNRLYPLTVNLINSCNGAMPDFTAVFDWQFGTDSLVDNLMREEAHIVFSILCNSGVVRQLLESQLLRSEYHGIVPDYADGRAQMAARLKRDAAKLLFHATSPMDPKLALAEVGELAFIMAPEFDNSGNKTGKLAQMTWQKFDNLPLTAEESRPIVLEYLRRWHQLSVKLAPGPRNAVIALMRVINTDSGIQPLMTAVSAYARVRQALEHEAEIIGYMRSIRGLYPSIQGRFGWYLDGIAGENTVLLSPEQNSFLLQTEKEYLR